MTKGRLGMIVCPMLEDEAIYNLKNDTDEKKVYLVKTPYNETIILKLKQHDVDFEQIDQMKVLSGDYEKHDFTVFIWTMFMGLHEDTDMLKLEMMNQIITVHNCVDTLLLYYGRCGRALDTICDWAFEMIPTPVCIFRNKNGSICDDCICIPIGGTDRYLQLLRKYPGRLYFTPAMASNFEGFMSSMELFNGLDTSNTEIMKLMLDMAGYTTIMEIPTGNGDMKNYRKNVDAFKKKYNLESHEIEKGWATNEIADLNYADAKKTMEKWIKEKKKERVQIHYDNRE